MPCYKPLQAFHAPGGISFDRSKSFGTPIELPCGRCLGCRLEKSKQWALRCSHEAETHDGFNSFVTLTYRNDELPAGHTLVKKHFQKFIKSLRQKSKKKIRYYMCGEYGEATEKNNYIARPHYHAILFGYQFPDAYLSNLRNGLRVYRSPLLEKTWTKGTSEIGSVTFQSAAYVARYLLKKQNGEMAKNHYAIPDPETGEINDDSPQRVPEYTNMSLKPGIGFDWYQKHKADIFPHDYCITPDGRKMQTPQYYRDLLERDDPELHDQLKQVRVERAQNDPNNTPERLAVRERCHTRKAEKLIRTL